MAENYYKKATEIFKRFDTNISHDWVLKNNLKEKANSIIRRMENAKSDEQFDKAAYDFKRTVVIPYFNDHVSTLDSKQIKGFIENNPIINMKPPSYLGSYDELKRNEVFVDIPYAKISVGNDGKKHVDVPLLRVINDPKILNAVAGRLNVVPEDLKEHIENEWNLKKQREWAKEEAAMRKAMIDGGTVGGVKWPGRKGVLKEFDRNPWTPIFKETSPDLYAAMRRDIANASGESGSPTAWQNSHMKEQLNDMIRNVGLSASATALPAMLPAKYSMAAPLATGAGVGATEFGAMANSPYYSLSSENISNIKNSAFAAATIPGGVQVVLGLGRKFGGPILSRAFSRARRSIVRGEETPSVAEHNALTSKVDEASRKVMSEGNGEYLFIPEQVGGAIQDLANKMNGTPKAILEGKFFDDDWVRAALKTKEGVAEIKSYFVAPSRNTFIDWNRKVATEESAPVRVIYRKAVEATEKTFPMALEEIQALGSESGAAQRAADAAATVLAKAATNVYGIKEPADSRRNYKEDLFSYESSNPEQVESWKRYGIPSWDPLAEEFNEKYGEGK